MRIKGLPFFGGKNRTQKNRDSRAKRPTTNGLADTVTIGSPKISSPELSTSQQSQPEASTKQKEEKPTIWQRLFGGKSAPKEKEWTVLVYTNATADSNIMEFTQLSPFRDAGSTKNVNFVAQIAREKKGGKAQRLYAAPLGRFSVNPHYDVKEVLPKTNMGSQQTLEEFLNWGMTNYPAKNYMVIFSGHGGGHRGVIPDPIHNDKLSTGEVADALKNTRDARNGKKIDVVLMDACLMGSTEVAYEIKDEAQYFIASPEVKYDFGIDYRNVAQNLVEKTKTGDMDPRGLVGTIMSSIQGESINTVTAVDLSKMGKVGESTKKLLEALGETKTDGAILKGIAERTQHYHQDEAIPEGINLSPNANRYKQLRDVIHFAQNIISDESISDQNLKKAANEILNSMNDAVVENFVAPGNLYANSHGLSINLSPDPSVKPDKHYEKLAFSKDTGWNGLI